MHQIVVLLVLMLTATLAQAQEVPKRKSATPAQAEDLSKRKSATPAQAEELPKRKSGLWEVKRSPTDAHPLQMCVEEKSDNAFRFLAEGKHKEACKVDKFAREGDKWIVGATCTLANHKITAKTHAVVTGKFDSAYKIESTSTFEQPVKEKTGTSAVIEQRWTGPCKPDQRPGDVILADGRKVNLVAEAKVEGRKQRVEERAGGKKKKTTTPAATQ
jgi:hypothetical protein